MPSRRYLWFFLLQRIRSPKLACLANGHIIRFALRQDDEPFDMC